MTNLPRPRPLQRQDALFLDFDGTLVAIARRPQDAVVASYLPDLLKRTATTLAGAFAIVSGRTISAIDDLTQSSVHAVAGIHGLERRTANGVVYQQASPATALLHKARTALAETAAQWPRVFIEHKGLAFALHYRLEPAARHKLRTAAYAAVSTADGALKLVEGDCVLEVMLRGSDKGTAVSRYLAEVPFQGRQPVFVGDDLTDETAFSEVERRDGLTVIVGNRRPTAARHALATVADVHAWIECLTANVETQLHA